ncbi:FtsH protease activity modulator HflK [Amylibacter sp. IMCC11727]|uniref:FtsH protease activity modulator HflK n=1 Tax=Amylibacter sp. IMCC11727 TaxID=3039851 RepID=UPI00244DF5B0|nr:FtsH protease activity modulator HflK [Amylibacter sp. IMCC11727]WGI20573.1 FtsH protease activity modulator HflK [Amylibacter sp. IMCC11727]
MAGNNSGGPWGGGGGNRGGDDDNNREGDDRRPTGGNQGQMPEIDEIVRKGQEQLRVLMGGKGGGGRSGGSGGGLPSPGVSRGMVGLVLLGAVVLWMFASFYRVDTSEQSVELLFGEYVQTGNEGLNFAAWPIVTKEIRAVTRENTEDIGVGRGSRLDSGLMLTGDENIVDIDFQVVWNISDLQKFLFNLAEPEDTIRAVSESAMREIIARSNLAPILNRDRDAISQELGELIQATLDSYDSGVNVVRVNFDKADPPEEVIDAFRQVQAAEQTRDTLEKQADAYANRVVAEARGEAAQLLEQAEGYRAQQVNQAEGEASRFVAVYDEYAKASEVTRKRLYLETMERVLGGVEKIIIDESAGGGQGVVPYLPLNELNKNRGGSN